MVRIETVFFFSRSFICVRYGLGTCYLRMSKVRLAEYHFRKATEIHPQNAVLLGCVGMVRLNGDLFRHFVLI